MSRMAPPGGFFPRRGGVPPPGPRPVPFRRVRMAGEGWKIWRSLGRFSVVWRRGARSSRIQKARPWVAAMRSLPWTKRSVTAVTGKLSCMGCHLRPPLKETYTPDSVPA